MSFINDAAATEFLTVILGETSDFFWGGRGGGLTKKQRVMSPSFYHRPKAVLSRLGVLR